MTSSPTLTCVRCGAPLGDLGGGRRRRSVPTPEGPACTFPASCEQYRAAHSGPRFEVRGTPKGYRRSVREAS